MVDKIDFRLLVISDRKLCKGKSLTEIAEECFRTGVKAFQLREKDLSSFELLHLAREIGKNSSKYKSKLIINDRLDIALLSKASGIHSPENGIPVSAVKKFGKNLIAGKSAHSIESAKQAEENGYDYILFGPIYRTPSKINFGKPKGVKELKKVCEAVNIPVFAIGGINPSRVEKCIEAGAKGVAVIGSIIKSDNIKKTVLEFKKSLGGL